MLSCLSVREHPGKSAGMSATKILKCGSIASAAKAMRAALRSRRSCSSSTSSATRARAATAPCPTALDDKALARARRTARRWRSKLSRNDGAHMSTRPPVHDWATDFDHLDPRWVENPYPIWDELRAKMPDRAYRALPRASTFPSRYEDVRAVAYDTEHFSSRRIIVRETPPPRIPAPPITSDPPEHRPAKKVLLPAFTPDAIKRHEPRTREICRKLIARFATRKRCDARGRVRAGNSGARDRRTCSACPRRTATVPQVDPGSAGNRHHRSRRADAGAGRDDRLFRRRRSRNAAQRPATISSAISSTCAIEASRSTDDHLHRHAAPAPDRRHRHDLERDRLLLLAPRAASRTTAGGSPPSRTHDPDRGRGVPARLCAGHHGARSGQGHAGRRLPVQARARWCCSRSRRPTAIRRCFRMPTA